MLICFDESFPSITIYFEHAAKFGESTEPI